MIGNRGVVQSDMIVKVDTSGSPAILPLYTAIWFMEKARGLKTYSIFRFRQDIIFHSQSRHGLPGKQILPPQCLSYYEDMYLYNYRIALAPNSVAVVSHPNPHPTQTVVSVSANLRSKQSISPKTPISSKTISAASSVVYV